MQLAAGNFVVIIPTNGLGPSAAVGIDAYIVAQLAKLPNHLGAGDGEEKRGVHLHAGQGRVEVTNVVIGTVVLARGEGVYHVALLVVAFHVSHQAGLLPTQLRGVHIGKIGAAEGPGGPGSVGSVPVTPKHHSGIGQHGFLAVIGKMFQDDVGTGAGGLHVVVIIHPDVDARLVVVAPRAHVVTRVHLGETLTEVEAVAVDAVLVHPVVHHVFAVGLGEGTFVVEIVADVVRVGSHAVEPRAVSSGPTAVRIHLVHRVLAKGVVQHHVEHHGHAAPMGFVDEGLEAVFGAVILVEGQVKARVVAPTIIALKLVHRHQLDAVYTEALQVAQRVAQGGVVVAGNEVAQMQLVHHQVGFGGPHEVVHLPLVGRLVGLKRSHDARLAGRVTQAGVGHGRNEPVVAGVQHLFGVRVGHAQGAVH